MYKRALITMDNGSTHIVIIPKEYQKYLLDAVDYIRNSESLTEPDNTVLIVVDYKISTIRLI